MSKSTKTVAAVIGITVVITGSILIFAVYNSNGKSVDSCIPNGSLLTESARSETTPLSGFAVSCVKIADPSGAIVMNGVAYFAIGQQQLDQGFQNVTSFGNCNGFATSVSPCVGMIFVFHGTQQLCFWMHNTILPLKQSWISANGTISAVYIASPETDHTMCYSGVYVLESNASSPISVGDRVFLNET